MNALWVLMCYDGIRYPTFMADRSPIVMLEYAKVFTSTEWAELAYKQLSSEYYYTGFKVTALCDAIKVYVDYYSKQK